MAETLIAKKGNQEKKFTRYAYDLMGGAKTGWIEVGEHSTPVVNQAPLPENGQRKTNNRAVVNEAPEKKDQPVVNQADKKSEVSASTAAEFKKLAKESLQIGVIKDYFDMNGIKYKQSDKESTMIDRLYGHFNGDIESLKKEFGL